MSENFYVGQRGNRYYVFWYDPEVRRTVRASLATNSETVAKIRAPGVYAERALGVKIKGAPVDWMAWAQRMCKRARGNAKARDRVYDLEPSVVAAMIESQDGRCAITGYPFSNVISYRNPFAPSLDQIKPGAGYTSSNIRIVLMLVNTAMNVWGPEPFLEVVKHLGKSHFRTRQQSNATDLKPVQTVSNELNLLRD